ncbi:MAG: VirB8/TrbF family protein [Succinivibrio sp.]
MIAKNSCAAGAAMNNALTVCESEKDSRIQRFASESQSSKEKASISYSALSLVFLSLSLGFLSLGFSIMNSYRSMYVPYLVTVDRQGSLIDHGLIRPSFSVSANMKSSFACDYIEKLYSVSSDKELQYRYLTEVFAMTAMKSQAFGFIEEYYTSNEVLSDSYSHRTVRIDSVASLSDSTFLIEFYVPSVKSSASFSGRYKSKLTLELRELDYDSLEELRLNPLGIFVTEITLSKIFEDNQ